MNASPARARHDAVGLMFSAASAVRAFNEQTRPGRLPDGCLIPPDAHSIIGSAAELAHNMPQALSQLAAALHRSVSLYRLDGRDRPSEEVARVGRSLASAGEAFTVAMRYLSDAMYTIADP